jgi:hypothetical protein
VGHRIETRGDSTADIYLQDGWLLSANLSYLGLGEHPATARGLLMHQVLRAKRGAHPNILLMPIVMPVIVDRPISHPLHSRGARLRCQ